MEFDELKNLVVQKLKEYPEYKERAIKELRRAKWLIKDGINIADEILNSDKKVDNRYVLPFFLGKTKEVDLSKPLDVVQVKRGGTGGLDIDTDFEPAGKEAAKKMLIEKYGADRVMGVGTYNTTAITSAAKDILRKIEVPFSVSNAFCKELNNDISWAENMENYRLHFPDLYKLYQTNQAYLDMVPKIVGQIKTCGTHAGGCVILDKPIWNYIPVIHTKEGIATALRESSSEQSLDDCSICKYDLLAITVLETLKNAVNEINEELVKIEDDDGIVKIVPKSYIASLQK